MAENQRARIPALSSRCLALLALAMAVMALGLAYIAEYGFGLLPCQMCYWQRIPFAVVIPLALLAWWKPQLAVTLLWLCVLAFAGNALLAGFHAGVEWKWWQGPTSCSSTITPDLSLEELLKRIQSAPVVSCTDAALRVFGLSMAGWNALYCAGCALLLGLGITSRKTGG